MEKFASISKYGMIKRIMDLHLIISSGSYPDVKTLCRKLERSAATIYRDLRFLKDDLMAPLKFDSAKNGYSYSEEYNLSFEGVSNDESSSVLQQKLNAVSPKYYGELNAFLDYLTAKGKGN